MAVSKPEVPLSAYRHDMNTIVTATSMISKSSYPMQLSGLVYDLSESGKSNMATSKPEIPDLEAALLDFSLQVKSNNILCSSAA